MCSLHPPKTGGYHVLQAHLVLQLVLEQAGELAFAQRSGLHSQHSQDPWAAESKQCQPPTLGTLAAVSPEATPITEPKLYSHRMAM